MQQKLCGEHVERTYRNPNLQIDLWGMNAGTEGVGKERNGKVEMLGEGGKGRRKLKIRKDGKFRLQRISKSRRVCIEVAKRKMVRRLLRSPTPSEYDFYSNKKITLRNIR